MKSFFSNIRFYVLCFTTALVCGLYFWVATNTPYSSLQVIKLAEVYAFSAVGFLYLALLTTPLYGAFPNLPFRAQYIKARRALGVSAFFCASLHAYFAFFKLLGGFTGLSFLDSSYIVAISLSATALLILSLMATTSFDVMVRRLGKRWKQLHQFVYLAGVLIVIHALLLGSHFANPANSIVARFSFVLIFFLLFLEAIRLDRYLNKRTKVAQFGIATLILVSLATLVFGYFDASTAPSTGIGIHSQHLQIAKDAQQAGTVFSSNPALQGDKTKRYSVSFDYPEKVVPGTPTTIAFRINDATTGDLTTRYTKLYEKFIHLVVVDSSLTTFSHIHPDFKDGKFTITTIFPKSDLYHLYINVQPYGAIEQQFAFTLPVGEGLSSKSEQVIDDTQVKTFSSFQVAFTHPSLKASELSLGNQILSFNLKNPDGSSATNLRSYLGAFGHLVMINQASYEYIHVHPTPIQVLTADSKGGPQVNFQPLGLYGPIKPGIYRVFAEFNPDNKLITTNFTVTIN